MNPIFLDTETTGNQPTDRLCQLSYKKPDDTYDTMFDELFKPPLPIAIEAMAVHHITEKMVAGKPGFQDSPLFSSVKELLETPGNVTVAHNAPFDIDMLNRDEIFPSAFIDTLKLVRHFDPEMKIARHNLQYLRYLLKLDEDITEPIRAHDAKSDVIILELLFERLFAKTSEQFGLDDHDDVMKKMIELSKQPAFIGKFTFGKYNGEKVADVAKIDRGYLEWLYKQKKDSEEGDEDWIFTLESVLGA